MASLKGYTTYVTRVRAVAERQAGSFSQSAEFLTDYTVEDESNSDNVKDLTLGTRQVVIAAARQQCANTQDWYYVQLTGNGGSGGSTSGDEAKPGEHGAVLVFPVTWSGERLAEHSFFYTGSVQTYRVPIDQSAPHLAHRIVALDVYAWGAGGAGARSSNGASSDLSNGGGGAFARGVFRVSAGDAVDILVGGGGLQDGRGGFNGGGNGDTGDFPGGGGGGASEVRVNGRTAVVAAGGGGAGSTDYCCAHGGGGGGLDEAESGLAPDATAIPLDSRVTGQAARDEYHSSNVPGDTKDFEGLPARHGHLDWGFAASSADYSVLATGGTGATPTTAGVAGTAGSYRYSLEGTCLLNPQTSLVDVAVSPLTASHWPSNGRNGSGGSGQSGKQAGGGGGGGFFGGGGGGAGVDGAGGGGGSSFVSFRDLFNSSKSGISDASLRARVSDETVDKLRVTPLTSSSVKVSWKAPRFGFSQLVEGFVIEMANRSVNEDFRLRLEDLIDGWRTVATASGEDESALDEQRPVPRYWAASAFVSSLPGSKVPRVFLFGGQDDTTLLDDFWSLELAQLDEDFPQDRRKSQRIRAFTHVKVVRSSNKFKAYKKLEPSLSRRASGTGPSHRPSLDIIGLTKAYRGSSHPR
ncbi:hypothetical protein PInf_028986 [Phytophthora infestans]|nr:hypothetical protein PInf_028986 [Phytophthora infestans]